MGFKLVPLWWKVSAVASALYYPCTLYTLIDHINSNCQIQVNNITQIRKWAGKNCAKYYEPDMKQFIFV